MKRISYLTEQGGRVVSAWSRQKSIHAFQGRSFDNRTPASAEAFTQYLVDVSPVVAALVSDQPPVRQAEYRHVLAQKFQRDAAFDGSFRVHNVSFCAVGRN